MITITQTASPSRSKQAGPCWIAIGDVYAAEKTREIPAERGDKITVTGKVTLKRVTRVETQHGGWTLYATGNPADTVDLSLGFGQSVDATLTGVSYTEPVDEPEVLVGDTYVTPAEAADDLAYVIRLGRALGDPECIAETAGRRQLAKSYPSPHKYPYHCEYCGGRLSDLGDDPNDCQCDPPGSGYLPA